MFDFEQLYMVSKEIYEAVQQAKENQIKCNELGARVTALEKVARVLEGYSDRDEATEARLERMLVKLGECLTFVREFSKPRNIFMKAVKRKDYKEELTALDKALTTGVIDLSSALTTQLATGVSKKRGSIFIKRTDKKEDQEERTLYILERLEKLFVEERYWNEKTDNYDTYVQCLKEMRPELALLYKYGEKNKHVLQLNQQELTDAETINELQKVINLAKYKVQPSRFLRLVAEGEQDKAEEMLKSNPALALVTGEVTDLSKRTFTNITAFQYAVWALDWHMWTMIKKYLPIDEAKKQEEGFETGSWVKIHGTYANLSTLIQAYQTTIDLYNAKNYTEFQRAWVQQVGGAQLLQPAHVVNEYCHPTRPFYPLPNFEDALVLPRSRAIDGGGEWFTSYNRMRGVGGGMGDNFAIYRGAGPARRLHFLEGLSANKVVEWEMRCLVHLAGTRIGQREELINELKPRKRVHQSRAY